MSKILYPFSFSMGFPENSSPEIARDNLIQAIHKQFSTGYQIAYVTGGEEIGKTNFLAQFTLAYPDTTFSCFLKPTNKLSAASQNVIIDLVSQLHFFLNKVELEDDFKWDLDTLHSYVVKLSKTPRERRVYYFILDGFENIDLKDSQNFKEIFEILPIGSANIKFLISDRDQKVHDLYLKEIVEKGKIKYKENSVLPFSLAEIQQFFIDFNLTSEQRFEIRTITDGIAGRVRSILFKFQEGETYESFFSNVSSYSDVLNREIKKIDFSDERLMNLLALISLEDSRYSIEIISLILKLEISCIEAYIGKYTFLELKEDKVVQFKSSHFKKVLRDQLLKMQNQIDEMVIEYHLSRSMSNDIDSIIELPKRYEKVRNFDKVIGILREEHFRLIIEKKESFKFLEEQTEIGIRAAKELDRHSDHFKLSLQKASISEVKQPFIWESEIESKIELKDIEGALQLANKSLIKEERFRKLVYFAKIKRKKGLTLEQELTNSIRLLYDQIDPSFYPNNNDVILIASDLMYSLPELAIEFLEKANSTNDVLEGDFNFVQLSMLLNVISEKNEDIEDFRIDVSSFVKDPELKKVTNAYSYIHTADDVTSFLAELKSIESVSRRISIARNYIIQNYKKIENVELVVEYVIHLFLVESNQNPITANALFDISLPVPYFTNTGSVELLKHLESFRHISKERGPSLNHYKYLINLAFGRLHLDLPSFEPFVIDVYNEISAHVDIKIKTEALSFFYKSVITFDKSKKLQKSIELEDLIFLEIESGIDELLGNSASHEVVIANINSELVQVLPEFVLKVCSRCNTLYRRDTAFVSALEAYLDEVEMDSLNEIVVTKYFHSVLDPKDKNEASMKIIHKFQLSKQKNILPNSIFFFHARLIKDFHSQNLKIRTYCILLKKLVELDDTSIYIGFLNEAKLFWESISESFIKIQFAFRLSTILSSIDKIQARFFHELAVKEKSELLFESPISQDLFSNTVRLGVFSLVGMINSESDVENEIEQTFEYIKFIPNKISQVELISDLLYFTFKSNKNLFEKIYTKHFKSFVLNILRDKTEYSKMELEDIIYQACVPVFFFNKDVCYDLLKKVGFDAKERCLDSICKALFNKGKKGYYRYFKNDYKVDYETALSLIDVINRIDTDVIISNVIKDLKTCARNNSFTKEETLQLKSSLLEIVDRKLPDSRNIKHNGYKILATAYVYKIAEKHTKDEEWNRLIIEAEGISNAFDKSLVLVSLYNLLPTKIRLNKGHMLKDGLSLSTSIKSYTCRVDWCQTMKEIFKEINVNECKELIRRAIGDSMSENTSSLISQQKLLLDFAFDIDKEFAEELVKTIEKTKFREALAKKMKAHLKGLKTIDDFSESRLSADFKETKEFIKACEHYVEKLLTGRSRSRHLKEAANWLSVAQKLPISDTFSIYILYVVNANSRFEGMVQNAKGLLLPIFESILKSIQMIKVLTTRLRYNNSNGSSFTVTDDGSMLVKMGEKQNGIEYIERWIQEEGVEYIKICDPYFSVKEVEFIKSIFLKKPEIKISIISSYETNSQNSIDEFQQEWSNICDQNPPDTSIVLVGLKNGKNNSLFPTHDRYITTLGAGLRLGGSLNGLGNRNTEISEMTKKDSEAIEKEFIDPYLTRTKRDFEGIQIKYLEFNL